MDKKNNTIELNIHFSKGKENLKSLFNIIEALMIDIPEMRVNVINMFADETNPNKITCRSEKEFTLDELKSLIDVIINKYTAWDIFTSSS